MIHNIMFQSRIDSYGDEKDGYSSALALGGGGW